MWDQRRGIREQDDWDAHAAFIDDLVDEGMIILGGPLGEGERAAMVMEASDVGEIESRFAEDPWAKMGLLYVSSIEPWTIWMDGRHILS